MSVLLAGQANESETFTFSGGWSSLLPHCHLNRALNEQPNATKYRRMSLRPVRTDHAIGHARHYLHLDSFQA